MRLKLIEKIVIIISFVILLISCSNEDNIPKVKLYSLDGKEIYSNSFKHKKLIYCYLSPECYSCTKFIKELQKLESPDYFFVIVFRDYTGFNPKLDEFEKRSYYDIYLDKDNEFPNKFNLGMFIEYPTFIIFENGKFIRTTTNKNNLLYNLK